LRRRWQEDLPPFLFAGYRPGGPFFSVAEWNSSSLTSHCPKTSSDELWQFLPNRR
jgi:hypothetical protein